MSKNSDHPEQSTQNFQEQRYPTTSNKLRFSQYREIHYNRRRIVDARLWGQMSDHQQESAIKIDRAYQNLSRGLGFRTSSPHLERTGGGGHSQPNDLNDHQAHEVNVYFKWVNLCQKEKLSHAASIDVLVFGKTCSKTDTDRRVRKGWAKKNLLDCLSLYCKLKGWPMG